MRSKMLLSLIGLLPNECCHDICDIPRILEHFSDPNSVKIWHNAMRETEGEGRTATATIELTWRAPRRRRMTTSWRQPFLEYFFGVWPHSRERSSSTSPPCFLTRGTALQSWTVTRARRSATSAKNDWQNEVEFVSVSEWVWRELTYVILFLAIPGF